MDLQTQQAIGLTQRDPVTRQRIQSLFGMQPNQSPIAYNPPVGGMTADTLNGTSEQGDSSPMPSAPRETAAPQEAKPYEAFLDKNKLYQQAPKVEQELANPDLPYAKAAAWNAFFSNLFQKTGGKSGGLIDAIAAYGNEYGKSLAKFSEQEAEYYSQRMRINQGAKDAVTDTLMNFDGGDELLNNTVRSLGKNPKMLEQYAQQLASTEPEKAKQVYKLVNQLKGIEDNRQENLLQASQVGGKVKTVKENNGLDADGNSVTQLVTTYENGKTRVNYVDKDGVMTTKPPKGFQTESAIKAAEDRDQRERQHQERMDLQRDKFGEETKTGPLKGGGYRSPDGIVYSAVEMRNVRESAADVQTNLRKLESLTDQDFKDAESPVDWTLKPHEVRTAAQRKTLAAQTKIKEAMIAAQMGNLPRGPASDKDMVVAASPLPGFHSAKTLKEWRERSIRGGRKALELTALQYPGGVFIAPQAPSAANPPAAAAPAAPTSPASKKSSSPLSNMSDEDLLKGL